MTTTQQHVKAFMIEHGFEFKGTGNYGGAYGWFKDGLYMSSEQATFMWRLTVEAEMSGMEAARQRVLRRTEIPKDAKNPTRDYVVVLGEEIANIIRVDVAELDQLLGEEI